MKKHYETHVEDTDKLISVAGPELDYKSWYEQYRKLMEEQAQRKYGLYTPTSEGDEDDFPSIPGMIARYSASGLTNEQMKENPVWVDKTGNGHDLQMKNFLWGEMSGVGGYNQNFNQYFVGVDESNKTVSDSSMKLVLLESDSQKVIYDRNSYQIGHTYNFYIKVTGIEGRMLNVNAGTLGGTIISITEDGIYSINATVSDSWGKNMLYLIFPPSSSSNTVTIDQLPLYPGALVFDGVDDYGICENFPILTKEKGYTVVALRQFLGSRDSFLISNRVIGTAFYNGAFIFERFWEKSGAIFYNFGTPSDQLSLKPYSPFSYLTSKSYNGRATNAGDAVPSNTLLVGKSIINDSNSTNAAIWEICILDHDATEEELQKIQDYYKQEYPWLFPDQAWTVTGKTNEDEDRATIANITGNGNNLVLSNFGFAENSGYGLYAYNFNSFTLKDNVVKPTDVKNDSFRIVGTGNSSNVLVLSKAFNSANWKIRVTGMKEGDNLIVGNANKSGDCFTITKDGIYTFQKQYEASSTNGVWYNSAQETDVLVEQIPEYEGYLVTDGVDDRIQDSSFKLNKDWTLVGEWVLLNQKVTNAGIVKPFSFVIYNRTTGLSLFINSGTSGTTIENVKSIKAICSDGRIYLDDWSEMLINKDQNITSSTSVLSIGFNGAAYTQIALKNLGIYNDQPLSKDDCIKAYNYLQTLKSK